MVAILESASPDEKVTTYLGTKLVSEALHRGYAAVYIPQMLLPLHHNVRYVLDLAR